jgi:molecular chaperone GrpE
MPETVGTRPESATPEDSVDVWRDRALRLQAEMENYRKRQRRLAEERILEERERLVRRFLQVADELDQALALQVADEASLRQGLKLTLRSLMQQLEQEGIERIPAKGKPFNPEWHEAMGLTKAHGKNVQPQTVVEELRPGYRLGNRVLRPARVLVSA